MNGMIFIIKNKDNPAKLNLRLSLTKKWSPDHLSIGNVLFVRDKLFCST